jgi:curli biogenesis system outer membrane secretion channel CsgG
MRTAIAVALVAALFTAAAASAQTAKPVIAVGNLRNTAGLDPKIVAGLDDMFITALQKTGKFTIVERQQLADLEREQNLSQSLKLDGEKQSLAQVNKLTGAAYYILGAVTACEDRTKESVYESMGVATTQHFSSVSLDIRVSDTTTGAVVQAVTVNREKKEVDAGTTTIVGSPNLSTGQMAETAREAVNAAALEVVNAVFPIKVMEIEDDIVFLNRGEGGGLTVGEELTVFAIGKELRDPDTNEVIGTSDRPVGKVRVAEILPKFSRARIVENGGIEIGNIVRAAR